MTEQRPDWLVPGAKVLVYSDADPGCPRNVRVSAVAKLAKKSFTVDGETDRRFSIDTQEHRTRDRWHSSSRRVVPYDSDEAQVELVRARNRNLIYRARQAVEMWEKHRTKEHRLAAIAALQAIQTDEENGRD